HEPGVDAVREDVAPPEARDGDVEAFEVGDATAEHDDLGVEHVDDGCEGAGHPLLVPGEGRLRVRVARGRADRDLGGLEGLARRGPVVPGEPRAREKGLDAPRLPAVARRTGPLALARPGQRVVTPLT